MGLENRNRGGGVSMSKGRGERVGNRKLMRE